MTDFEPGVRRLVHEIADEMNADPPQNGRMIAVKVVVGEPETGHWCDTCLLPSAAEYPLDGLSEYGVMEFGRIRACPDCGQIERR